jgi:hypothetical protein
MGVPRQQFVDVHKDKVNEIKRHLMDYVKGLRHLATTSTEPRPAEQPSVEHEVQITKDGYPLLRKTIKFKDLTKGDLSTILRMYLAAHYRKFNFYRFSVDRNLK